MALIAVLTILAGSRLPAMIVHALVDLRIVGLPVLADDPVEVLPPAPPPPSTAAPA